MSMEMLMLHAAVVAGLVAALRDRAPKVDGWMVWAVAVVMSQAIAFALADGGYGPAFVDGLKIAGGAIGGVSLAKYGAAKLALPAAPPIVEPAPSSPSGYRVTGEAESTPVATSREVGQ